MAIAHFKGYWWELGQSNTVTEVSDPTHDFLIGAIVRNPKTGGSPMIRLLGEEKDKQWSASILRVTP